MKRIYIAATLLLIALCTGAVETGYVSAKADTFIGKIENADRLMSRSEYREAAKLCRQTEMEWSECSKKIDMLLIHDYVDDIGLSISKMTSFSENGTHDLYFSESTEAKKNSPP